jgi:hypothetical protein
LMAKQFHAGRAVIARSGEAVFRFLLRGADAAGHVLMSVQGGRICHMPETSLGSEEVKDMQGAHHLPGELWPLDMGRRPTCP